jgi:hypothetical protein
MPSLEPVARTAARRSSSACVVKARCSCEHGKQLASLHHRELLAHIGEADGTLVAWLGENGAGGFAELHRPRTKPPQVLLIDRAKGISRAVVVGKELLALVGIT